MKFGSTQLVISDLQIPFEYEYALDKCLYIQKHYKISNRDILCVGDEVDQYFGSMYAKDPDAAHTPNSEISDCKRIIKEWIKAFPTMYIAESNHGQRWAKKAAAAEIPSQMMRRYQDVLETPDSWKWAKRWFIETEKEHYWLKHGLDCSGKTPYRLQAEIGRYSSVFGHLHASPGLCYVQTDDKMIWSMNVGCMIDRDAYAFHYGKDDRFKPVLTLGVVYDHGRVPLLIPV
jgi:hypothetical protein